MYAMILIAALFRGLEFDKIFLSGGVVFRFW
jgi:hypothetical protein